LAWTSLVINWPKWLDKKTKDNVKDERNWAAHRAGRTQSNSGRFWHSKGDTKDDTFLSDTKETERNSYTISRSDWETLTAWAQKEHRIPLLKIKFMGTNGRRERELVVIPADYLQDLEDFNG
jgi:hypothetical protein